MIDYFPPKSIYLLQDSCLNTILNSVFERACNEEITENEMASLQSVLVKLLGHVKNLEDIFLLVGFLLILIIVFMAVIFFLSYCLLPPVVFPNSIVR